MTEAKQAILQTTCKLLESQGYHGTGLNQILQESGAPKGSLYYYFPEGKEQLTIEAVQTMAGLIAGRITANLAEIEDAAQAVQHFVDLVADQVESSGFSAGGPLTMVSLETATGNEKLNEVCRHSYELLRQAFEEALLAKQILPATAQGLSIMILSTMEGAILLSRTYHSGDPLRQVGKYLADLIRITVSQSHQS